MPIIDINDIAQIGVIRDVPNYMLPPEVWTEAYNVISKNGRMEAIRGWRNVFGTPLHAPHFAMPINTAAGTFWIYTSLTKASVFDGNNHTDITRAAGGDYTADSTADWNGTVLAGIPILNNGADVPQFWADTNLATNLAALTAWPADMRTALIRALGPYLIALNVTVGANNYPHLVKWSDAAAGPGQLPGSWDETDEAIDAGEYDLTDVESGIIREARVLGNKLMIYKDQSTWAMRIIGGRAVMGFDQFSATMGILAARCVAATGDGKKHVLATLDDIVIHDGNRDPASILDKRMRSTVFGAMDTENYANSFMFTDVENNNIVFAYPEIGSIEPTRGLIFNYKDGALSETDIDFCGAFSGTIVDSGGSETWASAVGDWSSDLDPWNSFSRRSVLLTDKVNSKFHKWNDGYTRDGDTYESKLQRVGLSMLGRKRDGSWIVDHSVYKFVDRVWPKIQGAAIQVRLGIQDVVDGAIEWTGYMDFDPRDELFVDLVGSGRAIAVEFRQEETEGWSLDGYQINVRKGGMF